MPCKPLPRDTTARRSKATETPEDEQLVYRGPKEVTAYEIHLWRSTGGKDVLKEDSYFISILPAVGSLVDNQELIRSSAREERLHRVASLVVIVRLEQANYETLTHSMPESDCNAFPTMTICRLWV